MRARPLTRDQRLTREARAAERRHNREQASVLAHATARELARAEPTIAVGDTRQQRYGGAVWVDEDQPMPLRNLTDVLAVARNAVPVDTGALRVSARVNPFEAMSDVAARSGQSIADLARAVATMGSLTNWQQATDRLFRELGALEAERDQRNARRRLARQAKKDSAQPARGIRLR